MAETMIDEISASVITETGVQNDDEETWTYRSMKNENFVDIERTLFFADNQAKHEDHM